MDGPPVAGPSSASAPLGPRGQSGIITPLPPSKDPDLRGRLTAAPPRRTTITIGTRTSRLALWQARRVAELIEGANPDVLCRTVKFTTSGDRTLDRPIPEVGGKGVFTRELEQALTDHRIDVAASYRQLLLRHVRVSSWARFATGRTPGTSWCPATPSPSIRCPRARPSGRAVRDGAPSSSPHDPTSV